MAKRIIFEEKGGSATQPYKRPGYEHLPSQSFLNDSTMLVGGLSEAADQLIVAGMRGIGYKAQELPIADLLALDAGKEYCDSGLCNPTYFCVGNLIQFLDKLKNEGLSKKEICQKYFFLTAGSCGPCRFGMYEYQYQHALQNAGYIDFKVIIVQSTGGVKQVDSTIGMHMNFEFVRVILNGVILSDHLNQAKYRIKPYEVNRGKTDETFNACLKIICEFFEKKAQLKIADSTWFTKLFNRTGYSTSVNLWRQFNLKGFKKALHQCKKLFGDIDVDYSRPKPVVKITGEFWAQLTEGDGNYRMFSFLQDQGCEIIVEPVSSFLDYLFWFDKEARKVKYGVTDGKWNTQKFSLRAMRNVFTNFIDNLIVQAARKLYYRTYKKTNKWMGGFSRGLIGIEKYSKIAKPYLNVLFEGGEGFLEVAKNIYYNEKKLAHMVLSLKPFGCMPSTISDSVQSKVLIDHDDMIFLPLETSGEGKINAQSRVQMALGEAKEKMHYEYHNIVEKHFKNEKDWIKYRDSNEHSVKAGTKFKAVPFTAMKFSQYVAHLK